MIRSIEHVERAIAELVVSELGPSLGGESSCTNDEGAGMRVLQPKA